MTTTVGNMPESKPENGRKRAGSRQRSGQFIPRGRFYNVDRLALRDASVHHGPFRGLSTLHTTLRASLGRVKQ